jgi:hypothetical protein
MSEKRRLCFKYTGYNTKDKTKIIGKFIKWDVLCWEAQNYSNETVGVVTKPAALVELEDGSVGLWSYEAIQFDTETKTLSEVKETKNEQNT